MSICISLDLYFEMDPPMLENQFKKSQSRVASHLSPRWGMGCYIISSIKAVMISRWLFNSCMKA